MENKEIGKFIYEVRKEKGLTQKELGDILNITDKAVSKWERGLSLPDITIIPSLANALGISTAELINGRKNDVIKPKGNTQKKRGFMTFKQNILISAIFSALCLIAVFICLICDIASNLNVTWSLYPILSIAFSFFLVFPLLFKGLKGIKLSLIALSVLIFPFLLSLSLIIKNDLILPVGMSTAAIVLIYIWVVFYLFNKLKKRKLTAFAVALFLFLPFCVVINTVLSHILSVPWFDVWDAVSMFIILITAIILLLIDRSRQNKTVE